MENLLACPLCRGSEIAVTDAACRLFKCHSCELVFDNPRPTLEEIRSYYSRPGQYDGWLAKEKERESLWRRRLAMVLQYASPGSLMDVGAGIGQFLALARPHFSSVIGTEISATAALIASDKFGIEILTGTVDEIDFSGRLVQNLTMFHVLEHVPDPLALIRKAHSLLSPEGILFIAVPNEIYSLRNMARRCLNRLGVSRIRYSGKLGVPPITLDGSLAEIHLSHFSPGVLENVLAKEGFTLLESSLDPYYAENGLRLAINSFYFALCRMIHKITGRNFYETLWIVAKKQ